MFKPIQSLTKDTLLAKVDEYSILKHLLPEFKGIGSYKSNLRTDDKNESLNVTVNKGRLVISDFGLVDSRGMNIFNYAIKVFGYPNTREGFMATLDTLADNFKLDDVSRYNRIPNTFKRNATVYNIKLEDKQPTIIRYKSRPYFSFKKDYVFWNPILKEFNQEQLEEAFKIYKVVFAEYYWINDVIRKVIEHSPMYIYHHKNYRKLYSPYETKYKWVSNIPKTECLALNTLPASGEILIIDKSTKDCIINYLLGYPSIPVNSETNFIPEDILTDLKIRFKRIYIHMDNDEAGIRASKQFSEQYDLPYYVFPKELGKDNFEVLKKHNLKTLTEFLQEQFKTV